MTHNRQWMALVALLARLVVLAGRTPYVAVALATAGMLLLRMLRARPAALHYHPTDPATARLVAALKQGVLGGRRSFHLSLLRGGRPIDRSAFFPDGRVGWARAVRNDVLAAQRPPRQRVWLAAPP